MRRHTWHAAANAFAISVMLSVSASVARTQEPEQVRAAVSPPTAQLGERVTYRGRVVFDRGATVRWVQPDADGRFSWGEFNAHYVAGTANRTDPRRPSAQGLDTAFVEVRLQVFETGVISIPGLEFEVQRGSNWDRYRLPVVELPIVPVLSAADSNAALHPLRGPLGAPWWERVPWLLVLLAALALLVAWYVWRWMRNRKPAPKPLAAPVPVRLDPATEAMRELAALRKLRLPQDGRFSDHAYGLTRILKRFLERATGVARPGDTTPELVRRLAVDGGVSEPKRLGVAMRRWDEVKFARARSDAEEARGSEVVVESMIRDVAPAEPAPPPAADLDHGPRKDSIEPGGRAP